jgi:hypothetical protein
VNTPAIQFFSGEDHVTSVRRETSVHLSKCTPYSYLISGPRHLTLPHCLTASPLSASPSPCGRPTFIDKPHSAVASHLSSYRSSSLIKRQLPHNDRNLAISHPADPSSSFPVPIYGPVDIENCKRNLLIITKIRLPGQFQPCSYTPLQIYCFGRDEPGPCLILPVPQLLLSDLMALNNQSETNMLEQ